jgi:tetratricopeptide (TPR) repeat protein
MPMRPVAAGAVLLVVSVIVGAPLRAYGDAAQARVHFEKGRTFFQVDEYRKAIDEFKAAHVERPDPAFLYNIAECYRHLGETKDALTYYRRFLTAAAPGDRTRPTVEKRIAELQAQAAKARRAPEQSPAGATSVGATGPVPEVAVPDSAVAAAPLPRASAPETEPATLLAKPAPEPATSDAGEGKPFYKRGWFFAALGVVLIGGAVGVWAATRNPTQVPGTPLGNQGTTWQ